MRTRDGLGFAVGFLLGSAGAFGGSLLTHFAGGAALAVPALLALGGAAIGIWVMRTGIRPPPRPRPAGGPFSGRARTA